MNKEEFKNKFEKNVEYLQRNIPPDDIYIFAEQTMMAALFFMHKWSQHENISKACLNDHVACKWVHNILGLYKAREQGINVKIDLDIEVLDE